MECADHAQWRTRTMLVLIRKGEKGGRGRRETAVLARAVTSFSRRAWSDLVVASSILSSVRSDIFRGSWQAWN